MHPSWQRGEQSLQPLAHRGDRSQTLAGLRRPFADLDRMAAERIDHGETGFVGQIVTKKHRHLPAKWRLGHERADHLALARTTRFQLEHTLARLQAEQLAVAAGEVVRQLGGGLFELRRQTKMQGEGDALVFQQQPGMGSAGLRQLSCPMRCSWA